jgi:hypothetical protein
MKFQGLRINGFTRTDLLTILGLLVVCAAAANQVIMMVNPRTRANSAMCQANLAQVGRAFQLWASDHGDRLPILVSSNEGGLFGVYLAHNAWYHYAWISNELSTPKVLVCPADTNTVRRARDFSANPDGGFLHPNYRANALSYMVSLHVQFYAPGSLMNADRNITPLVNGGGCSYAGLQAVQVLQTFPGAGPVSSWGNDIHGARGNLLFRDGSVQETTSVQLRAALDRTGEDPPPSTTIHSLYPR